MEPGPINLKKLKPHSLRYEEIIRKNKEDLRWKRSLANIDESKDVAFKSRAIIDVRIRGKSGGVETRVNQAKID